MVNYPKGTHRPVQRSQSAADQLCWPEVPAIILPANKGISGLIPTEAVEAAHFIKLCAGAALVLPDIMYVVHVPNGGQRNKTEAKRMQGEGVRAGYPDYLLDVARGGYHGWRGELKRVKYEYPRPDQYEWLERLRECGYWANWFRGAEAMFSDLVRYLELPVVQNSNLLIEQPDIEYAKTRRK